MISNLKQLIKKPYFLQVIMPLLLGMFAVLGFAPYYLFLTTIASLVSLFYLWQTASSAKQAALIGFMYGLGLFG